MKGLYTSEVLSLMIGLGDFYLYVNDKVKHEKKFTSLKRIYNDLIKTYVKQTENIDFYIQIFESFSGGCELNYKSYQFIKIFYFISGYYYSNIDENRRYQSTKYFIDLYEQLIQNVLPVQITQKEIQIIEAICIRIMFEYPLTEEFFNVDNKKKNNNRKKSLNLTELNFGSNKNLPQIVNNSMSIDNNFIINTNASMAINNAPQSPSHSQSAYIEYETFNSLFLKISVSSNLNDYIIKSIFLVIFECNNNKQIPQERKMKFILKTKEYSDFLDYNFIGLKFYNHFVYDQFIKIAQMYDNNKKILGSISYDLFLFLTCQVGNQFQKNKCDKCTLNHFISSKKICERIFRLGLTQSDTFVTTFKFNYEFLIKRILPYTRKSFLFDLIYQLIMIKEKKVFGEELLNRALKLIFEDDEKKTKYYYIDKFNLLQLLTKLAKINGKLDINIDDEGINNLFNEEMMRTKFNALSPNGCIKLLNPKKKIYMENIFDVMVSLSKKTKNLKYIHILEAKFNASKIDSTNKNYFYLSDKNYSQKAAINKLFSSYGNMEIPSFCILMLGKVVKKYYKAKTEEYKTLFKNFAINAFLGAKLIWTEQKEAKSSIKENKDSIEVIEYNKVRQFIDEGIKKKTLNEENLLNVMQSLFDNSKINIDKIIDESSITNNNDNSFCSCSSTKSQKSRCALNKRKKYNIFTKSQKFNISNLLEKDKNDIEEDKRNMTINEQGPNQDFTFINQNNNSIVNYSMINPSNPFSTEIQTSSKSTNIVKTKSINPNIFEITNINSNKQVVLFPKHTLLKRIFSIYFKDILFYSKDFVKMKNYFKYYIEKKNNNGIKQNVDIDNFPDYPTEIKNYTAFKMFYNGLFLRHDFDFFTNEFFKLTHSYYQEQAKEIALKNNRLFIKKSNDEMIEKFVLKIIEEDKFVKRFKCELITNKNVVFGEITITSSFIFFHTMDKEKFLNSISVEEKEEYLLCSYDTDYSKRKKMVIMFKKDISEIMNRRFLYQFQACEIFLLNGKSYFFNFFSEDKKIEFFDHFRVIQKTYSQLKVITDLKEDFRTKDYTRKWLAGKMSNLHYLLMVNKYASRSYNDTNQYPVLPWVTLRDGTLRNLQFSIAAQTEAQKMYLGEKYDMGVTAFPAHYNIHFSNSSFVIYYMVRVNPFTNGQITLQSGKFDAPNRQMHSLDECMMILDRSHDSRELIPQFFISEEFFYNYNCNFYGFRVNDKVVIHNLSGYKYNHPYEYIIHNLEILNSSQVRNSLNFFIDNIFGVGQIGKRDNYNTYDKYCYQELVNLREKIREYIDRNSDYSTIKEKIERKINKIISFGQTPFKLFEEKHKEYSDDNNSSKGDEYNEIGTIISTKAKAKKINLKSKIVFVKASNDYENHPVLYICTLNKSQYQIKFYSDKLKEGKGINKITIQQKIKLLEKIKIFNDEFKYGLKYNPQFILIDYNINLFIICRFKDCSFTLFTNTENCEPKRILTESYITTIMKLPEKMFMTGHHNGKIMEWELKGSSEKGSLYFPDEKVQFKRSLLAHDGPITGIYKEENLGLIITSGEDHMIYIRKYYDLEVLSAIDISNQSCFELKISSNFIYTLLYDEIVKKYTVKMYTMNGSEVHRGDYDYINNMEIDENGNVLVGYFKENVIKVFDATMQKVIKTIEIEEEKTERDAMFMSFVYKEELGGAICIFSNSDIVKVEINY